MNKFFWRNSILMVLLLPLLLACRQESPEQPVRGRSTILHPSYPGTTRYVPFTETKPGEVEFMEVRGLGEGSDVFFQPDGVGEILLRIDTDEWERILEAENQTPPAAVYPRPATFTWDGEAAPAIGLSVIGRGSRVNPEIDGVLQRAQYRVDFETEFHDVSSLILKSNDRDPSYLRSFIGSGVMLDHGVPAPRVGFARLSLQIGEGEPKYLGLYSVQEMIDLAWVEARFGPVACAFEARKGDSGYAYLDQRDEDPPGKECYKGAIGVAVEEGSKPDMPAFQPSYEYKFGSLDCSESELALNGLIESLASDMDRKDLENLVDVEGILRLMALGAFMGNVDDFWVYGNNAFLCLVPNGNSWRWTVVPFDFDLIFHSEMFAERNPEGTLLHYGTGSMLGGRILSHPEYRARYRDILFEVYRELTREPLADIASRYTTIILPHVTGYDAFDRDPYDPDEIESMSGFLAGRLRKLEEECEIR